MNEEIKEILDRFKKVNINILFPFEIEAKDCKLLLDYITNLQQELQEANDSVTWWTNRFNAVERDNRELKKQKDDVVKAIKGILEINSNYSVEKLTSFYSRKWVEDTQSNLLRMLGEIDVED